MCGRYASTRSPLDLGTLFDALDETGGLLVPDHNIAPTDPAPIVRTTKREAGRVLCLARWGLVPGWAADRTGAARRINARAESVATSRAFGQSFRQRRCLVAADGWFEWLRLGAGRTQPYYMAPRDSDGFAFGGVWSTWDAGGIRMITYAIITVPAVGDLAPVHDRMPLVLGPMVWDAWLGNGDGRDLLAPPSIEAANAIEIRPVGAAVGNVRNDGPDLLRPVPAPPLNESTVEPQTLF